MTKLIVKEFIVKFIIIVKLWQNYEVDKVCVSGLQKVISNRWLPFCMSSLNEFTLYGFIVNSNTIRRAFGPKGARILNWNLKQENRYRSMNFRDERP